MVKTAAVAAIALVCFVALQLAATIGLFSGLMPRKEITISSRDSRQAVCLIDERDHDTAFMDDVEAYADWVHSVGRSVAAGPLTHVLGLVLHLELRQTKFVPWRRLKRPVRAFETIPPDDIGNVLDTELRMPQKIYDLLLRRWMGFEDVNYPPVTSDFGSAVVCALKRRGLNAQVVFRRNNYNFDSPAFVLYFV